jgi:hypothetical protein
LQNPSQITEDSPNVNNDRRETGKNSGTEIEITEHKLMEVKQPVKMARDFNRV